MLFGPIIVYGKRTTTKALSTVLSASIQSVLTKQRLFDRAGEAYTEVWLAYSESQF